MTNTDQISSEIKKQAKKLGFLECAILPTTNLKEGKEKFKSWLYNNMNGQMQYMERNFNKRFDPRLLFDNAKTIIIVLQNYFTTKQQEDIEAPILSKYAFGKDYHYVIKDKLNILLNFIQQNIQSCNGRAFTDSAPILERAWAKKAGMGWIGKNSNLISQKHGSFFFIGELIIDIELPYDTPKLVADHCGKCSRCIDACPTKAINTDRSIDARKCISYQTIELKGELDHTLKGKFKNRVFGCDICQEVCPWNQRAVINNEPNFNPKELLLKLTKRQWEEMDKKLFNSIFQKSPVKRTGYAGLMRNIKFLNEND